MPHTDEAILIPYEPVGGLRELKQLPSPDYRSVYKPKKILTEDRLAALRGEFVLARGAARAEGAGIRDRLVPPIDWRQDPHDNHRWGVALHTLTWVDPLYRLAQRGNLDALVQAFEVAKDWAAGNDPSMTDLNPFAWSELAVGVRAPYMAYTLRAALAAGICSDRDGELLLSCLVAHGRYLCEEENYARGNNHGLLQDIGLALIADYLPSVPESPQWARIASERFVGTLRAALNFDEGMYLEHTIGYQFWMRTVLQHIAKVAPQISGDIDLSTLVDRMTDTGIWLVAPDDRMPQIGDTYRKPGPSWAVARREEAVGLHVLPQSGYAIVREGGSYLIVAAAFHSLVHKHADDGSFCLYESGRLIVGEAGKFGYGRRLAARRFALRASAHNVLVVDGNLERFMGSEPYGSGIRGTATCDGWYAIDLDNPILDEAGVAYRRLLLYRPHQGVIVIDQARSGAAHAYSRYLQLGADIEAHGVGADETVMLVGPHFSGRVIGSGAPVMNRALLRGKREPDILGWTFPRDREWQPVWTVRDDWVATDLLTAMAVQTSDHRWELGIPSAQGPVLSIELTIDGRAVSLRWDREAARLAVAHG